MSPFRQYDIRGIVDRDLDNPLVDRDDATKVRTEDGVLREIGKGIGRYDAFETGCFLCSPALFPALERAAADRDDALRIIQVNFVGVVNGIYAALPLLRRTPNSLCFTTSSASAITATVHAEV